MQKLVNDMWANCTEADLNDGDIYRIPVGQGGWQQQAYMTPEAPKTVIPLTNVQVTGAEVNGSIYWAQEATALVITGDCALPDSELIVMAECVVDATKVVADTRFKAVFVDGKLTINARFDVPGNYVITQERINRGLDRIGQPIHLGFDQIEFDIYV